MCPMGLALKQLVPGGIVLPPPPSLPAFIVSPVDIIVANALPTVQYALFGGVYEGLTQGESFTATANGHSCSGVRFYRGDTHPVKVSLWRADGTELAKATGLGNGGVQTISFGSPVALTPGVLYCVTVFDTTPATSTFALAPNYWTASGTSYESGLPQGVGSASVIWGAGWMGADFLNLTTGTLTSYRNYYFNSGYGYGCPNTNASLGDMPVERVMT